MGQQWHLKISDKTFGPYSPDQVLSLLNHNEILPEDTVTASYPNGQWITVRDFVAQHSAQNLPKRPEDISSTGKTGFIQKPSHSAVDDLFAILQATKERKGPAGPAMVMMPTPTPSSGGSAFGLLAITVVILGGIGWAAYATWNSMSQNLVTAEAEARHSAAMVGSHPPNETPPAPVATTTSAKSAAPVPAGALKPALTPGKSSVFGVTRSSAFGSISLSRPVAPAPFANHNPGLGRHSPGIDAARDDRDFDRTKEEEREREERERQAERDRDSHEHEEAAETANAPRPTAPDGEQRPKDDGVVHSANADDNEPGARLPAGN